MSLKHPFLFRIQALILALSSRPTEQVRCPNLLDAKPVRVCDSRKADPGDSCNGYGPSSMRCWIPSLAAQHTVPRITRPVITATNFNASSIQASGHGRSSASMSLKNPFLFLIQVRESRKVACYHSDDVLMFTYCFCPAHGHWALLFARPMTASLIYCHLVVMSSLILDPPPRKCGKQL